MPDSDPLAISASALAAQRARLNIITEKLANTNTTRVDGDGPYQRKIVRFESDGPAFTSLLAGESQARGVRVAGVSTMPGAMRMYHPGHPDADGNGYVDMPKVNPAVEMVDLMAATRAYEANVSAIQAAKSMAQKALELGR
jgi:flagellar basal-body rod protein FlgC